MKPDNRSGRTNRPAGERARDGDLPDPDLWDYDPVETRPAPNGFNYVSLPEALRQSTREHDAAISVRVARRQLLGTRDSRIQYLSGRPWTLILETLNTPTV